MAVFNDAVLKRATEGVLAWFISGDIETSAARFYSLSFRAWQFLLGGSAFLLKRELQQKPGAVVLHIESRATAARTIAHRSYETDRNHAAGAQHAVLFPHKETLVDYHELRFRRLPVKSASEYVHENAPTRRVFADLQTRFSNVSVLDPTPLLCSEDCPYREGWSVLYKDDDHLSVYGAARLAPLFGTWLDTLRR